MLQGKRELAATEAAGGMRIARPLQRTLLVVAPVGTVSECLLDAVEREFPGVSVEQAADVGSALARWQNPVSLLLADATFLPEIGTAMPEISRHHPTAAVAFMFDDSWHTPDLLRDVLSFGTIRGVLPMNLKLDLWLSVMRLMLSGGEYFPPWLFQGERHDPPAPFADPSYRAEGGAFAAEPAGTAGLKDLTERELQILEMVSRGYQNKVIAAKFNLSEHTVKVHLHHIIKKLGAHNRTSAAAIFLGSPLHPAVQRAS